MMGSNEMIFRCHERSLAMQGSVGKSQRGFTLIELMVALVIMSIGLFAISHLQVVAVRGNEYAHERFEATQLAQEVAEELRTCALNWLDTPATGAMTFNAVFDGAGCPNIVLGPTPPQGTNVNLASVYSLTNFKGNVIASGTAPSAAYAINSLGLNPVSSPDLNGAGAVFRIHYVAYLVDTLPGIPADGSVVRVTIYVSWDNKNHGDASLGWTSCTSPAWYNAAAFFDRHMVATTIFLSRKRPL